MAPTHTLPGPFPPGLLQKLADSVPGEAIPRVNPITGRITSPAGEAVRGLRGWICGGRICFRDICLGSEIAFWSVGVRKQGDFGVSCADNRFSG
jgi:hypothetical protein